MFVSLEMLAGSKVPKIHYLKIYCKSLRNGRKIGLEQDRSYLSLSLAGENIPSVYFEVADVIRLSSEIFI